MSNDNKHLLKIFTAFVGSTFIATIIFIVSSGPVIITAILAIMTWICVYGLTRKKLDEYIPTV